MLCIISFFQNNVFLPTVFFVWFIRAIGSLITPGDDQFNVMVAKYFSKDSTNWVFVFYLSSISIQWPLLQVNCPKNLLWSIMSNFAFSHFLAKINKAKTQHFFSRICKNICEKNKFCEMRKFCSERTFGILCSDSSIFEVLLCHINNFSFFTLINVWWREFNFNSSLFKLLSSHFCIIVFAKFSRNDFSFLLETLSTT